MGNKPFQKRHCLELNALPMATVFPVSPFLSQKYAPHILTQFNLPAYFTALISFVAAIAINFVSSKPIEQTVWKRKNVFVYPASKILVSL